MNYQTLLSIFVTLLIASSVSAAPAKSLGDLNKLKRFNSIPFNTQSGNKIYFSRATEDLGMELWVTDGTVAGTQLLKDIVPGPDSSSPMGFAPAKISGQPGAYFLASTPTTGTELWVTDGTSAGTKLVKDIYPGNSSSLSPSFPASGQFLTIPESNFAFFSANDGTNGTELWVTDGTLAGTNLVADINPGASSSNPKELKYFTGLPYIFLNATSAASGTEPYVANETTATILSDIVPGAGSSKPAEFNLTTSSVIFAAENPSHGRELWGSDLSNPPSRLTDLIPGSDQSYISNLMQLTANQVLFSSLGADGDSYSIKLVSTDGTSLGTTPIADLDCLPGGILSLIASATIKTSEIINGHAVFPCFNILTQQSSIWVSDGTGETTKVLKDLNSTQGGLYGEGYSILKASNKLLFPANNGKKGLEPWVTDGTTEGTTLLMDINSGEASSIDSLMTYLTILSPQLNSTANLLPVVVGENRKVYYTDGSVANTRELFDDSQSANESSNPDYFTALGKQVIFSATDTAKGTELFITNGKANGTKMLKNLFKSGSSLPGDFEKLDDKTLLFTAANSRKGKELWLTDGTKSGTKLLKDIYVGEGTSNPAIFKGKARGKVFFRADDGIIGSELWVTKGTSRTTKLLKEFTPGRDGTYIDELVILGNKAIFIGTDSTNGSELWISNGRTAGTTLLKDIQVGGSSSDIDELVVVGNKVFFTATTAANGKELWQTDGTSAGTTLVKDIIAGPGSTNIQNLVAVGNNIFFTADDGINGAELWKSDGTAAGTVMVDDIHVGPATSNPNSLVAISNTQVVFIADDGTTGNELWIADTNLGSATLVKDISPGATSANLDNLYAIPARGQVVFKAETASEGQELWITNGTTEGTSLLADIAVGAASSSPSGFFAKGRKLYFSASTEATGTEPYTIRLP